MSVPYDIKKQVLLQMNSLTTNKIHQSEELKILQVINESITFQNSISITIVGTDDRYLFVDTIIKEHPSLRTAHIARLNGRKCHNDSHAMQQLYDIFLVGSSRNSNQVLEDLEYYFMV